MEDTEIWLISFVILPDRKQTYRLKTETDTRGHAYLKKIPSYGQVKISQHEQQSLLIEPEGIQQIISAVIRSILRIMACVYVCVSSVCVCL